MARAGLSRGPARVLSGSGERLGPGRVRTADALSRAGERLIGAQRLGLVGLLLDFPGDTQGGPGRLPGEQEAVEPAARIGVDVARRALAPDHEIRDGSDQVIAPRAVAAADHPVEGEQKLDVVAGANAVRQDVALQTLHVTERNAALRDHLGVEFAKKKVVHLFDASPASSS